MGLFYPHTFPLPQDPTCWTYTQFYIFFMPPAFCPPTSHIPDSCPICPQPHTPSSHCILAPSPTLPHIWGMTNKYG